MHYRENSPTVTTSNNAPVLPTFSFEEAEAEYQAAKDNVEARTRVLVEEKIKTIIDVVKNEIFYKARKEDGTKKLGAFKISFMFIGLDDFKFGHIHGDSQLVAREIQRFFPGFAVSRVLDNNSGYYVLGFHKKPQP